MGGMRKTIIHLGPRINRSQINYKFKRASFKNKGQTSPKLHEAELAKNKKMDIQETPNSTAPTSTILMIIQPFQRLRHQCGTT